MQFQAFELKWKKNNKKETKDFKKDFRNKRVFCGWFLLCNLNLFYLF